MTYSPIISATGAVPDRAAPPDSAAAPDPAATDPAGAASAGAASADDTLPGAIVRGAIPAQASAVPDPAGAASDPGTSHGQPAEPATETSYPYTTTGSAGAVTGSATDAAGSATRYAGPATDAAEYAAHSGQMADAGTAWPHQTFLELGALATAAPCARLHTTLVLWEWKLGTLVHPAGLVVSELVSNAVQASVGLTGSRFAGAWAPGTPPVRIWLSADDHRVVIQVWDGSDRPPVPQPVEPEADRGRGLLLVGALSAEWGCYTPEKSSGKVVWAVVAA